ncbi:kinase-like domain-containing protein [Aspergillus avenaceus]|uniref:Kinase-like domain-containing protein n=1 Tax=Aspergillus avenaceus TaxID=36643 RepID=A0A5N6TKJ6_ASPAV|nr:kinase-like domain-containing protein [Aspergillus avenaceus]
MWTITEQSEAFIEKDGDVVYDHTKIILRQGENYFSATVKERVPKPEDLDITSLDMAHIPSEDFCPEFKHGITIAPDNLSNTYIKRPSLVAWDPSHPKTIGDLVRHEAEICEILKEHPHPNITKYLGCVVKDGRITGLCLVKYTSTLSEILAKSSAFERAMYCKDIERGVCHLHQLGLVHNDLNPTNIMMDGNIPIIIDFDSCRRTGEKLASKAGTFGWEIEGAEFATPENDLYSLAKIRELMLQPRYY